MILKATRKNLRTSYALDYDHIKIAENSWLYPGSILPGYLARDANRKFRKIWFVKLEKMKHHQFYVLL
jgi:hypothetical protein